MIRLKIKHSICKYEAARRWNCFFEPPDKDWSVKILLKTGTKCLLSEVTDSLCPKLKWSWVCLFIQWGHSDSAGEREGCDGLWCDKQIAIALLSFYKFSRLENKPIKPKKPLPNKHLCYCNTLLNISTFLVCSLSLWLGTFMVPQNQTCHDHIESQPCTI